MGTKKKNQNQVSFLNDKSVGLGNQKKEKGKKEK